MNKFLIKYDPILKDKQDIGLYILKNRKELKDVQRSYFEYFRYSF